MVKELIRNGGFERGNSDFWMAYAGILEVQPAVKRYGSYAAKVTAGADDMANIGIKDYIEVSENELYKLTGMFKNANAGGSILFYYFGYDSDHKAVGSFGLLTKSGVFDWSQLINRFTIPNHISYISPNCHTLLIDEGQFFYIDSVSLQRIDVEKLATLPEELIEVKNLTTKNTYYGAEFFMGVWKQAEYNLYCSSLTGTSPTLDVTIQGYDPNTEQWKDVLVFQRLTTAGSEFKTVLSGLGWKQRVKYVLGGTTVTDCDFKVGVVYKR